MQVDMLHALREILAMVIPLMNPDVFSGEITELASTTVKNLLAEMNSGDQHSFKVPSDRRIAEYPLFSGVGRSRYFVLNDLPRHDVYIPPGASVIIRLGASATKSRGVLCVSGEGGVSLVHCAVQDATFVGKVSCEDDREEARRIWTPAQDEAML